MELRPQHVWAAVAAHLAVALLLMLTQWLHPTPEIPPGMEGVFVPPPTEQPKPSVQPTPAPTPPPTPAPTPEPTPPPPTPKPTPKPPDPAQELAKFTDAIKRKLECGNLGALRQEAAAAATAAQRQAAEKLIAQKAADCARQEEEKKKKEEAARLEQERKEREAAERKEQERREREERERQAAMQAALEAERRDRERAEQQARQSELEAQLQAEAAAREGARIDSELSRWVGQVTAIVRSNIRLQPNYGENLMTQIRVQQLPGGTITAIQVVQSSGNPGYDLAVQRALEVSSPLPPINDPAVFARARDIIFRFTPKDLR